MAANWSLNQVLSQLDSGRQWTGGTITYAFPQTSGGLYADGEAAGFRPTNPQQQALMVLALATWDDLMPQGFVLGAVGSTHVEFGYTSTSIGYAHAYYPTIGSAWFNVGESSLVDTAVGQYGFQTFVHEIGHAIGLNHMGDYNGNGNWSPSSFQDSVVLSIMSYFGPRYAAPNYSAEVMQADWVAADGNTYSPQTPMVNDVMAIHALYGASTTTRSDDTVYGFGSTAGGASAQLYDFTRNTTPILTLFDSGGVDTLDLSGWASPSRISLVPGTYSSANQMTNNLAIAYGTVIENARGGAAGDVIEGNGAANRLEGQGGDDQLVGGDGDDTLVGGAGDDTIDGGAGTDTAIFAAGFASVTVTITGNTVMIASPLIGTDSLVGVERFQFNDALRTLADLIPGADAAAPVLLDRSPGDDTGGVPVHTNLVLRFDEAVKAGSGEITIVDDGGGVFHRIAVGDTSQVQITGTTVTIDPSVSLVAGRAYHVTLPAGAITDLAGNAFAGLAGATAWNFSTGTSDTTSPRLLGLTPGDDTTGVALGADLVLQFDEPVFAGPGDFVIHAGGQVLRTIPALDGSQVTIAGATVTLNPGVDLPAGTVVNVTVDGDALRDAAGNRFTGISSAIGWNFTTTSTVADDYPYSTDTPGVVPVNGAAAGGRIETGGDRDLFRVDLVAGVAYTFELTRTPSGGLADPYLAIFTPTLEFGGEDDDSGGAANARLGYTAATTGAHYLAVLNYDDVGTGAYTLRARTLDAQAPVIVSRSPADDATAVAVGANLVFTFSEAVQRGSGAIRIHDAGGAVLREILAGDTDAVRISGASVTVDPGANLPAGSAFSVTIDPGAFADAAGNGFAGLTGATAWNFATAAPATGDDYPLSVSTHGVVTVGGAALPARIDSPNDGDLFKVTLTAGVTYRFDLVAPQTSPVDPYLMLYGTLPEVPLIDYDDDSGPLPYDSRLYFTPAESGTYFLAAYDYAEATGPYSIAATAMGDDFLGSTQTSGRLTVGAAARSGRIDAPTDVDLFRVDLVAGDQVTFALERQGTQGLDDPFLVLLDGGGAPVALDDDSGGDLESLLTYTAPASGTYYVAASDFDTGEGRYLLSAFVRTVLGGTPGNDTIAGGGGAETLAGGAGHDRLRGQGGDDILDGGDGIDFAVLAGNTGNFGFGPVAGGWFVEDVTGIQGRDLLYGVERMQFDDGPWALDVDGSAGLTVKILGAVFGAPSVDNETYVGIGLSLFDGGWSSTQVMDLALQAQLGPSPSRGAVVNLLYFNLFGTLPAAGERAYYESLLADGTFTPATLGLAAAESEWNLENIGFEDIELTGVPYQFVG